MLEVPNAMLEIMSFFNVIKDFFFLVGYVTNYNLFPEPLSPEEEAIYIQKYKEGDDGARKILIERLNGKTCESISKEMNKSKAYINKMELKAYLKRVGHQLLKMILMLLKNLN